MKALRTTLAAVVLFIGAMTVNAQSMSIAAMRSNARFLTDRMAYTLGIHDPYLIDEIYRINYDYIWGVNEYLDDVAYGYYYDDYMTVVAARDAALRNLLGYTIWNRLINYSYFYRPIVFANHGWHFSIYDYDRYGVNRFYYHAPRPLVTYVGGHFFRPMAPRGGHMAPPPAHNAVPRGNMPPAGAPRGNAVPRGNMNPGAAPGGAYRGAMPRDGQVNNMAPRMNGNINNNVNRNVNTNVNHNVNVNRNMNGNSTPNMQRGGTPNMGNQMRSGTNMNSSSRQQTHTNNTPSFTNASITTRSNANGATMNRSNVNVNRGGGATMTTRSNAGANMNRGGGATMNRGGGTVMRGGGRR